MLAPPRKSAERCGTGRDSGYVRHRLVCRFCSVDFAGRRPPETIGGWDMLLLLINILIIIVVGAICFYLIDRFVRDGRLGNLLKILVALICLAAIVQRLLPALGVSF
jgi:hypothetical protein